KATIPRTRNAASEQPEAGRADGEESTAAQLRGRELSRLPASPAPASATNPVSDTGTQFMPSVEAGHATLPTTDPQSQHGDLIAGTPLMASVRSGKIAQSHQPHREQPAGTPWMADAITSLPEALPPIQA